jgi:arylsulfatase A-like enzyme
MNPAVNEPNVSDKPMYIQQEGIRSLSSIRSTTIKQWETLLAVDEMVRSLVMRLGETGRLHDTLLIYTTDNGLSNREHRWFGKVVPYEQSNRVPMVVRYDGRIPPGTRSKALVSNVDIAPTIAEFSSATIAAEDGVSFAPLLMDGASSVRQAVLLEASPFKVVPPPYCGVRTRGFTFVRYATGEEELYDLAADPWQLRNVARKRPAKTRELRNLTMSLCQPTPPGFSW